MTQSLHSHDQPDQTQLLHVLVIDDQVGRRALGLEAATYSLGRDPTNAIVLHSESVSRQHALLLRVPIPGSIEYHYRVIDGNSEGKPSTNGVKVNGSLCQAQELKDGDILTFAEDAIAAYYYRSVNDPELIRHVQSAEFRSIKLPAVQGSVTAVSTVASPIKVNAVSPGQDPDTAKVTRSTSNFKWIAVIMIGILVLIGVATASWLWIQNQPASTEPEGSPELESSP